ncbi:Tapt1/CMV membrane protein receptor [Pycnococcus provasolii]
MANAGDLEALSEASLPPPPSPKSSPKRSALYARTHSMFLPRTSVTDATVAAAAATTAAATTTIHHDNGAVTGNAPAPSTTTSAAEIMADTANAGQPTSRVRDPLRDAVIREEVPPLHLTRYLLCEVDISRPTRGTNDAGAAIASGLKERERVYNTLLYVPWQLERLLAMGLLVCFDSCLGLFTFLPWRLVFIARRIVAAGPGSLRRLLLGSTTQQQHADGASSSDASGDGEATLLQPEHVLDVFWALIIIVGVLFVSAFDVSVIYHYIRGQEMVKLYVVYTVLEILDKICCSFGSDALEALAGTTGRIMAAGSGGGGGTPKQSFLSTAERTHTPIWYLVSDFAVATVLVCVHATIILTQAITFNVAINSHNNALLALLISNNFAEVKGIIFKRMDVNKLWGMACQDVTERFHIFVCFSFVMMEMALRTGSSWAHVNKVVSLGLTIFGTEILVDIIKHSVLGKFNQIRPGVYSEFLKDMCEHASHFPASNQIHRGVMFNPLPPAVVFVRSLYPVVAFAYRRVRKKAPRGGGLVQVALTWAREGSSYAGIAVLAYLGLCLLKFAQGVVIQLLARQYLRHFFSKRTTSSSSLSSYGGGGVGGGVQVGGGALKTTKVS